MHPAELKWADLRKVGPFHVQGQVAARAVGGVHDLTSDQPEGVVVLTRRASGVDGPVPDVSGRGVVVGQSPVVETVKIIDVDWFVIGTQTRDSLRQATFPVICSAAYLDEVARALTADCTPAQLLDALCRSAEAVGDLSGLTT